MTFDRCVNDKSSDYEGALDQLASSKIIDIYYNSLQSNLNDPCEI